MNSSRVSYVRKGKIALCNAAYARGEPSPRFTRGGEVTTSGNLLGVILHLVGVDEPIVQVINTYVGYHCRLATPAEHARLLNGNGHAEAELLNKALHGAASERAAAIDDVLSLLIAA
jgi:hypothetical protein